MKKRIISLILAIFMVLSMIPLCMVSVSAATTLTEDQFTTKIQALKKEYPNGYYWNEHNGKINDGSYRGTSKAGTNTGKCGGNTCTVSCSCSCGTFKFNGQTIGWQCFGFANLLAAKIFGSYATLTMQSSGGVNTSKGWKYISYSSSSKYDYHAGDFVEVYNGEHSIFIIKVDGSNIYYADCNWNGPCKINWNGKKTLKEMRSWTHHIVRMSGNTLTGIGTPSLTINYNVNGGTIEKCNEYKVKTGGSTLTLRGSASTSGSVLAAIPDGTKLTVTETKSAGGYTWGKTTYNGKTGWCALDYTVHQGYYADSSGKIFSNSDKKAVTQTGYLGKAINAENGLWNAATFKLTRNGYKFKGWCVNKDGSGTIFNESTAYKAEDIWPDIKNGSVTKTLYAIWESVNPVLTINYNVNGGIISTGSAYSTNTSGQIIKDSKPIASVWAYGTGNVNGLYNYTTVGLTRNGYTFKGWCLNQNGTGTVFDQDDASIKAEDIYPDLVNGSKTVTLYAIWESNALINTTITGISLASISNKESYTSGDTIDTSKITVIGKKSNGTYEQITGGFTVSPTTLSTEGTQKVTVSYNGCSTSFNVIVTNNKSTSTKATINVKPSGTYYAVQYLPNSTSVGFTDGPAYNDKCIILCKDGNYYLGFFPYGASDATITNGFLAYIPTNAFSSALNVPAASNYYLNLDAHATANVKVYHRPDTTSIGTNGKYTSFESLSSGQAVKVLFELNGYYCVKTSNSVGFVNKNSIRLYADDKITGISVATDSLTVSVGSTVNTSDIIVNATYLYSGVKAVTNFTVVQPDISTTGQKYAEIDYCGFKTFIPTTVSEPIIKSIHINSHPSQLTYFVGEEYDPTDLIVEAEYENGRKHQIFEYELSYDFSEPGTKDVTVTYNDFSDGYSVTVYYRPFVFFEDASGYYEKTVSVPVYYSAENLEVNALHANIHYNSDLLEYVGYENGDIFNDSEIVINAGPEKDSLLISAARDEKFDDECWLFSLYFTIKNPLSETRPEENTAIISFNDICLYGDGCEFNAFVNKGRVVNLGDSPIPGDGNCDGNVNAEDLIVLRKALLTNAEYSEALDANGDGVIDIRDLIRIEKYLVDDTTPLGKQNETSNENLFPNETANLPDKKAVA